MRPKSRLEPTVAATFACLVSAFAAPRARAVNPQDISIVGDLRVQSDFATPGTRSDRLYLSELELAYQGFLSPYARADVFIGIHPGHDDRHFDVEPEEAYVSLFAQAGGSGLRIGKFKASFGKLNRFHSDQWFTVERPAVLRHFLGPDGLSDLGAEATLRVPNPLDGVWELSAAVLNAGPAESLPGAGDLGKVGGLRLSGSARFGDEGQGHLDVGVSGLAGQATHSAGIVVDAVAGADITGRWRLDEATSLTVSSEYLALRRVRQDASFAYPAGWYGLANLQFLRQFAVGLQVENGWDLNSVGRIEQSASLFFAFAPWDSNRYRLQVSRTNFYPSGPASAPSSDTLLVGQILFILGPHRHAVQY